MADIGFCAVMSRPLLPGKPDTYLICTANPGHPGDHTSCDGHGHVLARWPRSPVEVVWTPPPDLRHG